MLVRAHEKHSVADAFAQYWPNLLHIQNYRLTPAIHTWSLSVEEHFYLLLPLLILLLHRWFPGNREVRFLPVVAISTFAICLALRIQARWHTPYDFVRQMSPTHLRMDSLFFGVLLAWFYNFRPHWRAGVARYRGILFIAGLALLIPMMVYSREESFFVPTFGVSFAAVGYSMILIATVLTAPGVGFAGKLIKSRVAFIVEYVGLYSYSIYLWHMDLMRGHLKNWLHPIFDHQRPEIRYVLFNLTFIVVAIVSGIVMAKLIESPSLKLRDRLFPARAGAMQSAPRRAKVEDAAITSPV
jgi:peptidoglycan/LPS O-acetylase OafA/YrhL